MATVVCRMHDYVSRTPSSRLELQGLMIGAFKVGKCIRTHVASFNITQPNLHVNRMDHEESQQL